MSQDQLQDRLNRATLEALKRMREGCLPKLAATPPEPIYLNGCPILREGPQRDDL